MVSWSDITPAEVEVGPTDDMASLEKILNGGILVGLYALLFCYCGFQLGLILYHRHKKASYHTYFLLLCLSWITLRIIFFGIWSHDLGLPDSWAIRLIYWLPLHIQFATFSLLVLFYAQVIHRENWVQKFRVIFVASWVAVNVTLLALFIAWLAVVGNRDEPTASEVNLRQGASGVLFFILITVLGVYGWKLQRIMRDTKSTPIQVKGTTRLSIVLLTSLILVIFVTRCIYNFVTAFGTHHHVFGGNTGATIFAFCAFVLWEITPLFAVTFFFRHIPKSRPTQKGVRRPLLSPDPSVPGGEERGFFQNPNRYDELDEDAPSGTGTVEVVPFGAGSGALSGSYVGSYGQHAYDHVSRSFHSTPSYTNPYRQSYDSS